MSFMDEIEGGSFLPHVYCKKIILERQKEMQHQKLSSSVTKALKEDPNYAPIGPEKKTENILVTLKFELLASKNNLDSSWLTDKAAPGENGVLGNMLNSIFLQIIPVVGPGVSFLKPSNDPTSVNNPSIGGNVFVSDFILGKNWLPRQELEAVGSIAYSGKHAELSKMMSIAPPPLQISTSSTFGAGQPLSIGEAAAQGKLREEIKNGKPYYIVPIEYQMLYSPEDSDLGFVFYTFLNIPYYIQDNYPSISNDSLENFEDYIMEGSVNTEIVFENNQVTQTREEFFQPGGVIWEGPVHLHTSNNPSPDGYFGDGGFGINRGWMTGQTHHANRNQPKLQLIEYPNYKIDDFRGGLTPPAPPNVMGIVGRSDLSNEGTSPPIPYSSVSQLIGGFDKKTQKYFLGDNDNEYSKLYVSRDATGTARAMFYIDFNNLIRNNSYLYRRISGFEQSVNRMFGGTLSGRELFWPEILKKSKIVELKVFRDRVKEKSIGRGYSGFRQGSDYQEPSKLIGTMKDLDDYGTPDQKENISEVVLDPSQINKRFFMITDKEMATLTAGTYQYRVEIYFKDGSYHFINEFLNVMKESRRKLEFYYNLSLSGIRSELNKNYRSSLISREYRKSSFKPYFDSRHGSFSAEFISEAERVCEPNQQGRYIWESAADIVKQAQFILSNIPNLEVGDVLISMINPQFGSPQGIELFIKIMDTMIVRMGELVGVAKDRPGGGALTETNSSNFSNNLDEGFSAPAKSILYEEHAFNSPSSLCRTNSNNLVYVDYLEESLGTTLNNNFFGLRHLGVDYYRGRCRLDVTKFTDLPTELGAFRNQNIGMLELSPDFYNDTTNRRDIREGGYTSAGTSPRISEFDSMAATGYSFLTPSVVSYRDSSGDTKFFSSFSTGDVNKLLSGGNIGKSVVYSQADYDGLYGSLLAYSATKKETNHSDALNLSDNLSTRAGSYKNLMNKIGITMHTPDLYDRFYSKEPGAVNRIVDGKSKPLETTFPLKPANYSDGGSQASIPAVARAILCHKKQSRVNAPRGTIMGHGYEFGKHPEDYATPTLRPNNFKLMAMMANRKRFEKKSNAPRMIEQILENPKAFSSFTFFHFNMTAKIEVFTGFHSSAIPKDDSMSWRALTENDLSAAEDDNDLTLFCRIKHYNRKLLGDFELVPILNEYFLISARELRRTFPEVKMSFDFGLKSGATTSRTLDVWKQQNTLTRDTVTKARAGKNLQEVDRRASSRNLPFDSSPSTTRSANQGLGANNTQNDGRNMTTSSPTSPTPAPRGGGRSGGGGY